MDAGELRSLWEAAGGGESSAPGAGLLGLPLTDDPAALTGTSLASLGLPLNGDQAWPREVRRASQTYADWLPATGSGLRAVDYGDVEVVVDDPAVAFMQGHERLADVVAAGAAPLVLGGDALVSVPVLQVLSGKMRGRLGVVAFTPAYEVAPEPLYSAALAGREPSSSVCSRRTTSCSWAGATPPRTAPVAPCSTARRHSVLA